MLQELKMDIDPDFSPWLTTANMSEYDKEERRIIFWNIYYSLKRESKNLKKRIFFSLNNGPQPVVQITASQRTQITLSSSNMKFLQQHRVSNPAFLFTRFLPERTAHFNPSVICHLSGILDIMQQATIHYKAIPKSATEIVLPSACTILIRQLGNLENNSLRHMLASSRDATLGYVVSAVVSNNSHTPPITPVPHLTIDSSTLLPILSTTFLFNAAVCILHRPQLYLTAHLPITSPLLAFPESYQALNTALLQSVTAARTITSLNSALAHTMREDFDSVKYDPFTSFVLFEAAIVLWFATTKTPAYWFKLAGATPSPLFLTMGAEERRAIRGEVLDVLRALKELEDIMGSHAADDGLIPPVSASARVGGAPPSNMLSPMVTAVTAMIEEMQAAEQRILAPSSVTQPATGVEELLIGMKVMALDDPDDARGTSYVDEPYCYLGLLGVKCGSFRWHGALEPAWQRFWASCLNS
ncbi:hypothetical protein BC830DRAFT_662832 [Chytriomyces sp. MP71]|nr:hypothetical protein BC830DRAFT_662832 [Chytriomyces sp. MP71]